MGELSSFIPTFRDPAGSLTIRPDGVYRSLNVLYAEEVLEFIRTPTYGNLVSSNRVVASEILGPETPGGHILLQHPRISFNSYPWEWPPSMWLSAAELTLDLSIELLSDGWILKDATPLNVLFQGANPIFVDVPSIQRVDRSCPLWFAYAQFVRTFVLPVLAFSQLGWPLQTLITRRDGYEPDELYKALPWLYKIKRPALTTVTLPTLFANRTGASGRAAAKIPIHIAHDSEVVTEVLRKTLTSLKQNMRRAMPPQRRSRWSDYVETATHYEQEDHADKVRFVETALSILRPTRLLDVGCNVGVYSKLAANFGAEVVAIDTDPVAVDRVALDARNNGWNILPLCVDVAHPTPATGWENRETASFLDRCHGHFDTVLMLAVIHHLLLSSQIPLPHLASLCGRITTANLIIEWIPPSDSKFIEILRGRESIYKHIDERHFRDAFAKHFHTVDETKLHNGRILLHLRKH